jgi:hypothetical protein
VLAALGAVGAASVAGCLGGGSDDGGDGSDGDGGDGGSVSREPPLVRNRPDAVYLPSHVEGMNMVGTEQSDDYAVALSYTFPHRFWTMEAAEGTKRVNVAEGDSVHMMLSVYYPEAGVYVTDAAPRIDVVRDGETVVANNNPWAMLSQPMGFHFGDNVALDGPGTYTVGVETSAPTTRRTRGLAGTGGRASVEFEVEFEPASLRDLTFVRYPDRKGSRSAASPMDMGTLPLAYGPETEDLPGTAVGTGTSGDAEFRIRTLPGGEFGADGGTYLAVAVRTPYNGFVIPGMTLDATVERGGTTAAEAALTGALDPGLDFHYGAAVDALEPGDEVTVDVVAPPQVARHEGYETAFLDMDPVTATVPEGVGG